ncbi:CHAT domain-containing protein [Candidatus Oscillochloris fontis]|uniref:CHAT domain-containing protein n=1 Tax=Candidatus Oscillochloris fontis TaxID=2496868 RepID=UPI00101CCD0A|nr:CHAT domain-containing protein [Candidatus Oscillochloris fontis]
MPTHPSDDPPPTVDAQISAADGAQIEASGHHIEHPPGAVRTRTHAGKGATISGSGITIIGATPTPTPTPAPQPSTVSLELAITSDGPRYCAEARFTRPDSSAEVSISAQPLALDLVLLRSCWPDERAYGAYLSQVLFGAPTLRDLLLQALAVAQALRLPLRLVLRIAPVELQALYWETLRHPTTGAPLLTSQQVWCARSLPCSDWTPLERPAPGALRALGLIAAPTDLARYNLAPMDAPAEVALAHQALHGFAPTILAPGAASIHNLGMVLRSGCDILYLIAHGAIIKGIPRLWLEHPDGTSAVVDGTELALRIGELDQRPRLVVLISCHSAGRGSEDVAAALGPRLITAGVAAVLAMQGQISMATASTFTPALFAALRTDGQIDRATTEARAAIRERPDWWMPVLFTRMRR